MLPLLMSYDILVLIMAVQEIPIAFNRWFEFQSNLNFNIDIPTIVKITPVKYNKVVITYLFQKREYFDIVKPFEDYSANVPILPIKFATDYDLWNNEFYFPLEYSDSYNDVELPDTVSDSRCKKCNIDGELTCFYCEGHGFRTCESCERSIVSGFVSCSSCDGKGCKRCGNIGLSSCICFEGTLPCVNCGTSGKLICEYCNGTKRTATSKGLRASNIVNEVSEEIIDEEYRNKGIDQILHKKTNLEKKPSVSLILDDHANGEYKAKLSEEIAIVVEKLLTKTDTSNYISDNSRHINTRISIIEIKDIQLIEYKVDDKSYELLLQESTGFSSFENSPWSQQTNDTLNSLSSYLNKREYNKALGYINDKYPEDNIPKEVNNIRNRILTQYIVRDFFLFFAPYLLFLFAVVFTESKDEPPLILVLAIGGLVFYWLNRRHNKRK